MQPHHLIENFRIRGPGSSLPALIDGGFLRRSRCRDRRRPPAAQRRIGRCAVL